MYLVKLDLKNFRAIHQMSLDFRDANGAARRWTVLLGENGCGKSSMLKALGLLLAGSEALPDVLGVPDQWIRTGQVEAHLRATITTAAGQERDISLVIRRGDGRDTVIKRNAEGLAPLDDAIRHAKRNYFIAGYGAFRRPPDPDQKRGFSSFRTTPLITLFSASQDLVSLEQWAIDLDYRTRGNRGLKIIAEALNDLLPGMTFSHIDKKERSIILSTDDGPIPLRQLSEGYQSMAAWAGDLLYRMTDAFSEHKDPLRARGVLLLDEMDLHLHPIWKRRLVDYLDRAFPNLQIVATTHSPLSIQECGEGELYVVKREKRIPRLIPFVGDPSRMRLSELFLSPLIGLDTLDSPSVSRLRETARTIELKLGRRTPEELKRLDTIKKELRGTIVLDPREVPAYGALLRKTTVRRSEKPSEVIPRAERILLTGSLTRISNRIIELNRRSSTKPVGASAKKPSAGAVRAVPAHVVAKKTTVNRVVWAAPAKKTTAKKVTKKK